MWLHWKKKKNPPTPTYPEGRQDDPRHLLLDRLLEDVGEGRHHIVAAELLAQLWAEGQQPHTEDHLVLKLEATFVAQNGCDAGRKREEEHIRMWEIRPDSRLEWNRAGVQITVMLKITMSLNQQLHCTKCSWLKSTEQTANLETQEIQNFATYTYSQNI